MESTIETSAKICADTHRFILAKALIEELGASHKRTCEVITKLPLLCFRARGKLIEELTDITCVIDCRVQEIMEATKNGTSD